VRPVPSLGAEPVRLRDEPLPLREALPFLREPLLRLRDALRLACAVLRDRDVPPPELDF